MIVHAQEHRNGSDPEKSSFEIAPIKLLKISQTRLTRVCVHRKALKPKEIFGCTETETAQ